MSKFVRRENGSIVYVGGFQAGYAEEELSDNHPDLLPFAKQGKLATLNNIAGAKIQAGLSFAHNGHQRVTVLSTERLQVIMGIYALVVGTVLTQAGLMGRQGLPDVNYPPGDIPFETKDGTIITLTRAQAVALAQQALGRMVLLTGRRNALMAEINSAGNMATLNAIDLNSGWPA